MKVNRRLVAIAAGIAALSAGGVGIAQAVGGGSEEQVSGPDAEKAKSAALEAVGGGTVTEVERDDEKNAGGFEVEVRRNDGSQVEVHINDRYQAVGTKSDDDSGSREHDDGEEGADNDR